jgi:putative redox protein
MSMTVKAAWTGGIRYLHTSGTGHALVTDGPEPNGGDTAPTPMELVLHGLAGCTGVDLSMMLSKMRQNVTGLEITVDAERADEHPRVYTAIRMHIRVSGDVDPRKFERALELSHGTYCSVSAMLSSTAAISTTWDIVPTE